MCIIIIIILFLFFCLFQGHTRGIWKFPGQGSNRSCSHRPTPEPQQHSIQAMSVTYTTAHGNAGSLTHPVRPGIEPTTSWFLAGFFNHCAMMGTSYVYYFCNNIKNLKKSLIYFVFYFTSYSYHPQSFLILPHSKIKL